MVAKKKKIAASKPGAPPASSPVTGKKKTIHATTTMTTTGDDHRAHRAQEQQQKQQQQPPQQQQQRVSRLGKAVQDAATIKKKPKNKGQHFLFSSSFKSGLRFYTKLHKKKKSFVVKHSLKERETEREKKEHFFTSQ